MATPVAGNITLDGAPLNEAAVMFVPLEEGRTKTGALIVDGKYVLPAKDGLLPGAYRVEIVDNPPLDSVEHKKDGSPSRPKRRRTLPPEYTHKSPFRLEVPSGGASAAPLEASFELKTNVPGTK